MTARITCLVPFCRHSRGDRKNDPLPCPPDGYEWICGQHGCRVPRQTMRLLYRARRRGRGPAARRPALRLPDFREEPDQENTGRTA